MCKITIIVYTNLKWLLTSTLSVQHKTKKIKNILMNKLDDNNSFLLTKDYGDLIKQIRKSKIYL